MMVLNHGMGSIHLGDQGGAGPIGSGTLESGPHLTVHSLAFIITGDGMV